MKSFLTSSLARVALLVTLSGCSGGTATPESLAKDSVARVNELATLLENAKSIDDVKPKIDAVMAKLSDLTKQAEALKIPEEKRRQVQESIKPQMDEAGGRMMKAMLKLAVLDPKGMERLSDAMQKFAIEKH